MGQPSRWVGPQAYLEDKPSPHSVRFGGRYINLLQMAGAEGFDHSYLSRIISGERNPSSTYARRVAAALRMSLDEFFQAVEDRKEEVLNRARHRIA